MSERFAVAGMQAVSRWMADTSKADEVIKKNVKGHLSMLDMLPAGANPVGGYPKFVCYPEFSIQGVPIGDLSWGGDTWQTFLKAVAVDLPGEVTDEFGKKTAEKGVYAQACVWERAPSFGPDIFFESVFITGPSGKLEYIRRRTASLTPRMAATPGDVYTEYLKKYGPDPVDAFFPVLETPYGGIGGMMCCELSSPEVMRGLVLNGAELVMHSTSEPPSQFMDGKYFRDMERRVRAHENKAYLLSANIGLIEADVPFPSHRDRGHTELIDYNGNTVCVIEAPGESILNSPVDMGLLRRTRDETVGYYWSSLRTKVYSHIYDRQIWPVDTAGRIPYNAQGEEQLKKEVREDLKKRKIFH